MKTCFDMEIAVAIRHREYEREAEAEVRTAQACPENGGMRWLQLPHLILARLRSFSAPRVRHVSSWRTTAGGSMQRAWKEGLPL